MKRTFILRDDSVQAHFVAEITRMRQAGVLLQCDVKEYQPKRTTEQNDRMWAMLGEISRQVDWYGQKLEDWEWKDVFSASLKKQRAVPAIDGGFVILGTKTSKMSIREMSDLMELMSAFGAERGVQFRQAA